MTPRVRACPVEACSAALAGVTLGALSAPVDLVAAAVPRARHRAVAAQLRRIVRWHGPVDTEPVEQVAGPRCARYLLARSALGFLAAGVVVLLVLSLTVALSLVTAWLFAGGWSLVSDAGRVDGGLVALAALPGLPLVFVLVVGVIGIGALDRRLAGALLGAPDALRRRVAYLTTTRDEVVDAVDEERRRIERDLHDGLQQRLVAIGVALGRASRTDDPQRARAIMTEAAAASRDALRDLREVTDRIYPAALADGLTPALDRLREQSGITVELDARVGSSLRPAVATAAYFAVSEAVTNAAKHAGTESVRVEVREVDGRLWATVTDEGRGGADPHGSGLVGVARRVAAVDGTLRVHSPPGGPTLVRVMVPCA